MNNSEINISERENKIFHINRLELVVNEQNEIVTLFQSFSSVEELASLLSEILDRVIIDNEIKISPKDKGKPLNEQIELIKSKRNEILLKIREHQIDTSYITSSENSDGITRAVEEWTRSDEFRKMISDL